MTGLPDGPTEDSTDRDGAFSYAGEWHAFFTGVGVGMAAVVPSKKFKRFVWYALSIDTLRDDEVEVSDAMAEARSEGWYAMGGVVFGVVLGLLCQLAALVSIIGLF